jgi:tetratricopeptide (TPR) repeat protein
MTELEAVQVAELTPDEAREIFIRQASDIVPVHGPADIGSQSALLALGKVRLAQKEYGEAASMLRQACDAITNPYHTTHLACQASMGEALKHLECYDQSISFYARALDGSVRMLGVGHHLARKCPGRIDEWRAVFGEKGKDRDCGAV